MALYELPVGLETRFSLSSSYSQETRVRKVEFGDGYIQRTPLGLNNKVRRVDVSFDNLTTDERNVVLDFFDVIQQGGHAVILPYNELLSWDGKFYPENINVSLADNNRVNVNVSFVEVFDL